MRVAGWRGVVVLAASVVGLTAAPAQAARTGRRDGGALWTEAAARRVRHERSQLSQVARAAMPAVVSITTEPALTSEAALSAEAPEPGQRGIGSGFVIHPDGYILTSSHVVEGAREVRVALRGRDGLPEEYLARVVGQDPRTDCALLKIDAKRRLPVLRLASARDVEIADWIVVIGSPFGLSHTVTVGVVSFKGRTDVTPNGRSGDFDYLQTDASINPGNSGGPVLDARGDVIGIANAVNVAGQGISFAVPIDIAKAVLPQLRAHGRVRRGWLGVSVQDASSDLVESLGLPDGTRGVVVTEVVEKGPGARGGLRVGDVITRLDGKRVTRAHALRWELASREAGRTAALQLERGRRFVLNVKVPLEEPPPAEEAAPGAAPAQAQAAPEPRRAPATPSSGSGQGGAGLALETSVDWGAKLEDLSTRASPDAPALLVGALVRTVEPDGLLGAAGLSPGDVVLQVDGRDVAGRQELLGALERATSGDTLVLQVRRQGRTLPVRLQRP